MNHQLLWADLGIGGSEFFIFGLLNDAKETCILFGQISVSIETGLITQEDKLTKPNALY